MMTSVFEIDAQKVVDIGEEGAAAFLRDGVLLIRNAADQSELIALKDETATLVEAVECGEVEDTLYKEHKDT